MGNASLPLVEISFQFGLHRLRTDVTYFIFVFYYLVLGLFVFVTLACRILLDQILYACISHRWRGRHHLRFFILTRQLSILHLKLFDFLLKILLPLAIKLRQLIRIQTRFDISRMLRLIGWSWTDPHHLSLRTLCDVLAEVLLFIEYWQIVANRGLRSIVLLLLIRGSTWLLVYRKCLIGSRYINLRFFADYSNLSPITLSKCRSVPRCLNSSFCTDTFCKWSPVTDRHRLIGCGALQLVHEWIDVILGTAFCDVVIKRIKDNIRLRHQAKFSALCLALFIPLVYEFFEATKLEYLLHSLSLHLRGRLQRNWSRTLRVGHQWRRSITLPLSLKIELLNIINLLYGNGVLPRYGLALLISVARQLIAKRVIQIAYLLLSREGLIQKAIDMGVIWIACCIRNDRSLRLYLGAEFAILTIQEAGTPKRVRALLRCSWPVLVDCRQRFHVCL